MAGPLELQSLTQTPLVPLHSRASLHKGLNSDPLFNLAKAFPNGLVRSQIWRKGRIFGHSAESCGKAAIGLKPLARGHQPPAPTRPATSPTGPVGHTTAASTPFSFIEAQHFFVGWRLISIVRSNLEGKLINDPHLFIKKHMRRVKGFCDEKK